MLTRPLRKAGEVYDVQALTGYSVSTVPGGNWARGQLYRGAGVPFTLPPYNVMRDPTDQGARWNPNLARA